MFFIWTFLIPYLFFSITFAIIPSTSIPIMSDGKTHRIFFSMSTCCLSFPSIWMTIRTDISIISFSLGFIRTPHDDVGSVIDTIEVRLPFTRHSSENSLAKTIPLKGLPRSKFIWKWSLLQSVWMLFKLFLTFDDCDERDESDDDLFAQTAWIE